MNPKYESFIRVREIDYPRESSQRQAVANEIRKFYEDAGFDSGELQKPAATPMLQTRRKRAVRGGAKKKKAK